MMKNHYEKIREAMEGVSLMQLSRDTGIAYNTLRAIAAGTANPQWSTIQAVDKALSDRLEGYARAREDDHETP